MATLREITDNIAALLNKPHDEFTKQQAAYNVQVTRALILSQQLQRHGYVEAVNYQTIGCLPMVKASLIECCNVVDVQCQVKRTQQALPVPIYSHLRSPFAYVGGINGDQPYTYIDSSALAYHLAGRYAHKLPFYSFVNGYVYVFNDSPKTISVKGIFEDPQKLQQVTSCDDTPCFTFDSDYPITAAMIQQITRALVGGELRMIVPPTPDHERTTEG